MLIGTSVYPSICETQPLETNNELDDRAFLSYV